MLSGCLKNHPSYPEVERYRQQESIKCVEKGYKASTPEMDACVKKFEEKAAQMKLLSQKNAKKNKPNFSQRLSENYQWCLGLAQMRGDANAATTCALQVRSARQARTGQYDPTLSNDIYNQQQFEALQQQNQQLKAIQQELILLRQQH